MRFRWRAIHPLCGLCLFAFGTLASIRANRNFHNDSQRYFWWSTLRLDSDPLNKHSSSRASVACAESTETCWPVDPVAIWVDPGWLSKCFVLSVLPAFLVTLAIVRGLAGLGVSELTSFFISMPLLTVVWLYSVGWAFDRWRGKRLRT
jgi:hypothetical protein